MTASGSGERTRLVGRATELTQLIRVFQETRGGEGSRGRLVILSGASGSGKTALAEGLLCKARAEDTRAVTLLAQCLEDLGPHRPYGPFRDFCSQLGGPGGDGLASVLRKEAPGWLPAATSAASRNALFDQFIALCRALARQRPLVLLIDDLQWCDRSSLDLLTRLGCALPSLPALVVATCEVSEATASAAIKGLQHRVGANGVELAVRELDAEAVRALAESRIDGSFADELAAWLVTAAQGSPLRVLQLLHLLTEKKLLRKRLFRYAVRESELPHEEIKTDEIIAARLDAMEPNMRWTLEAAALSGAVVDATVVTALLGKPGAEALALLQDAARLGVLGEIGERRWAAGIRSRRFLFRHPSLRRVAQARVSGKRREHLIGRAAAMLERLGVEGTAEQADEIATLYQGVEGHAKVHEWALKAADLAERLYALYEVDEYLRAAARTTDSETERLGIETRLASIFAATGREQEAEAMLSGVVEKLRDSSEKSLLVSAGVMLGWLQLDRGVPPLEISGLAVGLVDTARAGQLSSELVMALDLSCVLAEQIGRAEEALLMAEEALYVAEQSGSPEIVANAAYRLASVHVSWGTPEEGLALAQRALELFGQTGDAGGEAVCHDLLGSANFRAGEWDSALRHWELALESMEIAGVPDQKVAMQLNIGDLLTLRGDFSRAERLLKAGARLAEELDDQALALRCLTGAARLELERGNYAAVLEQTEEVRKRLPESGAWKLDFLTTAARALSYMEMGDELQAWHEAARLEQLYQGKEGWFERRPEGDAVRIRVIGLDSDAWLAGKVAEQGIGETTGKDPYGEGFLQYHRSHVLAQSQPGEARRAAGRAVELFEKLGAAPMLARARQRLAELPEVEDESGEPGAEIDIDKVDRWFDGLEG